MSKLPTFFPLKFSTSMLDDLRCETMFFRRHIQCLQSTVKSPDLIAGGHIAKACELVRNAYFTQGLDEYDAIELGVEYILEAEDIGDSTKTNENVAYCLEKYFKKFKLSEAFPPCSLANGTHSVEYKFDFDLGIPHPDLPDRNITFTGRLDYLCENVTLGKTTRHGLDEKTCKAVYRLPNSKIIDYAKEKAKYMTNSQILSYSWATRQLGITLDSFIIRRIPIMATFEPAFELEIPVTQFAIDNWYQGMIENILKLKEKYLLYKNSTRNPLLTFHPALTELACMSYSRPCMYQDGCTISDGEALLADRYMQRIYDRENRIEVSLEQYIKELKL